MPLCNIKPPFLTPNYSQKHSFANSYTEINIFSNFASKNNVEKPDKTPARER